MAAALYLLVLPQPWVVRVDTRAMYSTAARGAAAASRWLRLPLRLPQRGRFWSWPKAWAERSMC